jgi:phosphohistidine phosphatase SixA
MRRFGRCDEIGSAVSYTSMRRSHEAIGFSAPTRFTTGPAGNQHRMRYVELRRHTDNDGDQLSEQGITDAEALGRDALHPPYSSFVSSGAARATEMLVILRTAAHQTDVPISVEDGLRSAVEDRWRAASKAAGKGASIEDMRAVDADLVEQESRLLGQALRRVVDALPPGGRALVVGHSPTNEAAVLGLIGQLIGPMEKGAGVLIVEDDGSYTVRSL